jgi:hypothetical protein
MVTFDQEPGRKAVNVINDVSTMISLQKQNKPLIDSCIGSKRTFGKLSRANKHFEAPTISNVN